MTDLDKKIQKSQVDLVPAVMEAAEKNNLERVDLLITNAFKQLKMSRFKPDQITCVSLTYLARVKPRVFSESTMIKDTLKAFLRRDNGPANIMLPTLAANILLACCDGPEVRTLVLQKIEQWISTQKTNQISELVQHLLATLCMKCKNDEQTVTTLMEMRQYWMPSLYENYNIYGSLPPEICSKLRKLLKDESQIEQVISFLEFLLRHDMERAELGREVIGCMENRPITFRHMLSSAQGPRLYKLLLNIFKLCISHEREKDLEAHDDHVFVKPANCDRVISLSRRMAEGLLRLMADYNQNIADLECKKLFDQLLEVYISDDVSKPFLYHDLSLTKPCFLTNSIRRQLIQSTNDKLIRIGVTGADTSQLLNLLCVLGSPIETINLIISRLKNAHELDTNIDEIGEVVYFKQLMHLYQEMGADTKFLLDKC